MDKTRTNITPLPHKGSHFSAVGLVAILVTVVLIGSVILFRPVWKLHLLGYIPYRLGFLESRSRKSPGMQSLPSVSVTELQSILAKADGDIQLIDVREPQELAIANLNHLGFQNYPLGSYEQWRESIVDDLKLGVPTYVLCHHGMRSAQMTAWLIDRGFTDVTNISGGIAAWSSQVDPAVPQY
ncbi:MAG: rhodanese-like domain-containing protein [Synechococcus sp.]